MFEIFFHTHSFLRWIIVLLAVFGMVRYLLGWLGNRPFEKMDVLVMTVFKILYDVQVTLGIVVFIAMGVFFGFPAYHFTHAFFPLCGLVVLHSPHKWEQLPAERRYRNSFFLILSVAILIAIGVAVLPQGWTFEHVYRMR